MCKEGFPAAVGSDSSAWCGRLIHPHTHIFTHGCTHTHARAHTVPPFATGIRAHQLVCTSLFTRKKSPMGTQRFRRLWPCILPGQTWKFHCSENNYASMSFYQIFLVMDIIKTQKRWHGVLSLKRLKKKQVNSSSLVLPRHMSDASL